MLLCSTIIETGVDVPTTNTIVMARCRQSLVWHKLLLSVYRNHQPMPDGADIEGKEASQRLDAIQQMEELGSGFYLAMHDRKSGAPARCWVKKPVRQHDGNRLSALQRDAARAVESLRREPVAQPAGVTTQINLHARPPAAVRLLRRRPLRLSFTKLATAKR
jgi:transcription-repair coupling factor (superfamily II helicase)